MVMAEYMNERGQFHKLFLHPTPFYVSKKLLKYLYDSSPMGYMILLLKVGQSCANSFCQFSIGLSDLDIPIIEGPKIFRLRKLGTLKKPIKH